jgi:hypothetical protein
MNSKIEAALLEAMHTGDWSYYWKLLNDRLTKN